MRIGRTGQPDLLRAKPGAIRLYVNSRLVGDTDLRYTTLFSFNPGSLFRGASAPRWLRTTSGGSCSPESCTRQIIDLSAELIKDSQPGCAWQWPDSRGSRPPH